MKKITTPRPSSKSGANAAKSDARLYKPTSRECALLLLHLLDVKGEESGREVTRLRIAEISLKRLWLRTRISPELIEEVSEWLASVGVAIFYSGNTYALIRASVVDHWPRATSKSLTQEIKAVSSGAFDFAKLEHLFTQGTDYEDAEDRDEQ